MDISIAGEVRDWLALILIIVIFIKVVLQRSMPNDPETDTPTGGNGTETGGAPGQGG